MGLSFKMTSSVIFTESNLSGSSGELDFIFKACKVRQSLCVQYLMWRWKRPCHEMSLDIKWWQWTVCVRRKQEVRPWQDSAQLSEQGQWFLWAQPRRLYSVAQRHVSDWQAGPPDRKGDGGANQQSHHIYEHRQIWRWSACTLSNSREAIWKVLTSFLKFLTFGALDSGQVEPP